MSDIGASPESTTGSARRRGPYSAKLLHDIHALREKIGDSNSEYDRRELLAPIAELIAGEVPSAELYAEMARDLLDKIEKQEKPRHAGQLDFFDYAQHVALGENMRIKRGAMTLDHARRRHWIIDGNKVAIDQAWAAEKKWLQEREQLLMHEPAGTMVAEVMSEDGTPLRPH